jgi:diguanylate cyclase (GGDEF)-like protein/PAS domain S-box-containing protein
MPALFASTGLSPHGFCLLWDPGLLWLHGVSDVLTGLAYLTIPLALLHLVRRRPEMRFGGMGWLFAAFITACGVSHFMSVLTLFQPDYWAEGMVKAFMAASSVLTATLLWRLMPQALSLPSPRELQTTIDKLRQTEARLTDANTAMAMGEQMAMAGNWRLSLPDFCLSWSEGMNRLFGVAREDVSQDLAGLLSFYRAGERDRVRRSIERALAEGGEFEHAVTLPRETGEARKIVSKGRVELNEAGQPAALFGVVMDETEARRRTVELAEALDSVARSEARYRALVENVSDLVTCIGADMRRTYVSPSSLALLGYTPAEMLDLPSEALCHPEDWGRVSVMLGNLLAGQAQEPMQYRLRHKDGRFLWIEAFGRLTPMTGQVMLSIRDIASRRAAQEQLLAANAALTEMARLDGLTGLANRRRFDETLQTEFGRAARTGQPLSLILLDVDLFKYFNDRYGHPAGDECLRTIGAEAQAVASRPHDLAARYGGEEFAIILPDTGARDAAAIAERLRLAIRRLAIGHEVSPPGIVTASFGVATAYAVKGAPVASLLNQADRRLYRAKAQGRDCVVAVPKMLDALPEASVG